MKLINVGGKRSLKVRGSNSELFLIQSHLLYLESLVQTLVQTLVQMMKTLEHTGLSILASKLTMYNAIAPFEIKW